MNKPEQIRKLLTNVNKNRTTKGECGFYLLGQPIKNGTACTAWRRAERGKYPVAMGRYFDLLLMVCNAADQGEQWALDLLADFLVGVKS